MVKNIKLSNVKKLGAVMFLFALSIVTIQFLEVENTSKVKKPPKPTDPVFYNEIGTSPINDHSQISQKKKLYTIEISATKEKTEAQTLIEELKAKGINSYYTTFQRLGVVYFRVRTGIYPKKKLAEKAKLLLESKEIKGYITQL